MDTILSQKAMPWGNMLLGTSKYYIHAYGSALTALAEILGITPTDANDKLNSVQGFSADKDGELDQIIWEKIVPAFPGWSAQYTEAYNNDLVLQALSAGRGVIVFADGAPIGMPGTLHAVRYIGDGKCHDPFTGTERPTNDFPDVKGFVVLTNTQAATEENKPAEEVPTEEPKAEEAPAETTSEAPPPDNFVVTLANLPPHEKQAVIGCFETALAEVKKLLGV